NADTEGKKRVVRITEIVHAEEDGTADITATYREKGGFGKGGNIAPSSSMNQPAPGGVVDLFATSILSYDAYGGEGGSTLGAAFAVPEALAIEGTISTSYIIEGLSTIPSDTDLTAQAHKVTVAVVDLAADLARSTLARPLLLSSPSVANSTPFEIFTSSETINFSSAINISEKRSSSKDPDHASSCELDLRRPEKAVF
ncbi:5845_t:CDS:2, partial [Acaulospora colombiana]